MKEYQITKSVVECYKLRHKSGMYWADITVDANGTTGRIQIASDYGSWQYYWGACGTNFKKFLLRLNMEYAADKMNEDRFISVDKTLRNFKRYVIEYRRREDIEADNAREIFNEIKELEEECSNGEELKGHMHNKHRLLAFFDWCPDMCYEVSPRFRQFWENCWPAFCEQLKTEIDADNQNANLQPA